MAREWPLLPVTRGGRPSPHSVPPSRLCTAVAASLDVQDVHKWTLPAAAAAASRLRRFVGLLELLALQLLQTVRLGLQLLVMVKVGLVPLQQPLGGRLLGVLPDPLQDAAHAEGRQQLVGKVLDLARDHGADFGPELLQELGPHVADDAASQVRHGSVAEEALQLHLQLLDADVELEVVHVQEQVLEPDHHSAGNLEAPDDDREAAVAEDVVLPVQEQAVHVVLPRHVEGVHVRREVGRHVLRLGLHVVEHERGRVVHLHLAHLQVSRQQRVPEVQLHVLHAERLEGPAPQQAHGVHGQVDDLVEGGRGHGAQALGRGLQHDSHAALEAALEARVRALDEAAQRRGGRLHDARHARDHRLGGGLQHPHHVLHDSLLGHVGHLANHFGSELAQGLLRDGLHHRPNLRHDILPRHRRDLGEEVRRPGGPGEELGGVGGVGGLHHLHAGRHH